MADLKNHLLELARQGHAFQRAFVADLSPVERDTDGTWENWSIKDELAHVIAWQLNAVARLAALADHEDLPDFSDIEKINIDRYRPHYKSFEMTPLFIMTSEG